MNYSTLLDVFKTLYQNWTLIQAHDYISLDQVATFVSSGCDEWLPRRNKKTARNYLSKYLQRGFPIKKVQYLVLDHRLILTMKQQRRFLLLMK